jgi:hypothetical protein
VPAPPCEEVMDTSPKLSVVSYETQSGVPDVEKRAISKSAVLQDLQLGSQQELVLPVSRLGLQQWASWALEPSNASNCFSALSEGLQVSTRLVFPSAGGQGQCLVYQQLTSNEPAEALDTEPISHNVRFYPSSLGGRPALDTEPVNQVFRCCPASPTVCNCYGSV